MVIVADNPAAAAMMELQREADRNARDIAFVPGNTPYEQNMRGLMVDRPDTALFQHPQVNALREFIGALSGSAAILQPIRSILISSHANPEGLLYMPLSTYAVAHITYEDLEAAVRNGSLRISQQALEPRPHDRGGQPIPARVLIRGCRIGNATVYMRKLKEAFGNQIPVIAPKHFHVVARQTRPLGHVEYMAYGFSLARPVAFRNQAEAIAAFAAAGFSRIDGAPVPPSAWGRWIPRNIAANNLTSASVISPITNARDSVPGEFRVRQRTFLANGGSMALATDPGSDTARKHAVRDDLVAQFPRYRSTHDFPEYVRYGHASMDEFMDSWTWRFRYDAARHLLHYNATRVEYVVIQAITDPASNRLLLNFYPSGSTGSRIVQLDEADVRFFQTV
ncbi:MAG: hypothetical protein E6Q88_07560 [Lysobacteraceae bacterium]|nr:MAG: hypothetical protein E6Q88_07560 [Xanthomonadaceae bacterium]